MLPVQPGRMRTGLQDLLVSICWMWRGFVWDHNMGYCSGAMVEEKTPQSAPGGHQAISSPPCCGEPDGYPKSKKNFGSTSCFSWHRTIGVLPWGQSHGRYLPHFQTRLVVPVNLRLFLPGPGSYFRIASFMPLFQFFRVLLICPFPRLLGRKTPALQVIVYGTQR